MALIKPQFEAQKEDVGEKGVVRRRDVHENVIKMITDFVTQKGWTIEGLDFSPIRGPEGNIEFLAHLTLDHSIEAKEYSVEAIVDEAHKGDK